jgi:hypothetical protein
MLRYALMWACLLSVLLLTPPARGEYPLIPAIPVGDDLIVPLSRGQVAPFGGQLYSPDTAIRWGNWLTTYKYRLTLDVEKERSLRTADKKLYESILEAEKSRALKVEASLTEHLLISESKRMEAEQALLDPPWYRTVTFGVVMGIVGSVAVLAVSIWALEARGSE